MKGREGQDFKAYRAELKQRDRNIQEYLQGRVLYSGGTYSVGRNEEKRQRRLSEGKK